MNFTKKKLKFSKEMLRTLNSLQLTQVNSGLANANTVVSVPAMPGSIDTCDLV
jgi:hypothetical protein